ncbi:GNAT family N-acetyltransferase [Paenibacillus glycanilyticus]|uniref:GNAT family N-acetyltransferase n=1 Tax=Paenibacillus glycanilyticus TaxID=126569 RepID=UPI0020417709|nr:GNAT family N-acetyltransferase [Paenibacillus glycanilyticus]MCM3625743.1 GNAT family N-acetyltransferase [Paenibacillus glycanilyticus]
MGPRLDTNRLILRLFEPSDAKTVQSLAGNEEVARTTLSIPHPYPDGAAEAWIERIRNAFNNGDIYSFAMVRKTDEVLIGCVSLRVAKSENQAELGYWVGHPYWGQGYATEAAQSVCNFGFTDLNLKRIFAAAMTRNPASYNVMKKIGMKSEDNFPKQILKSGVYEDLVHYALTH